MITDLKTTAKFDKFSKLAQSMQPRFSRFSSLRVLVTASFRARPGV